VVETTNSLRSSFDVGAELDVVVEPLSELVLLDSEVAEAVSSSDVHATLVRVMKIAAAVTTDFTGYLVTRLPPNRDYFKYELGRA